jgi:hypothetical protein
LDFVTRQFIVLAKKLREDLRKSLADLNTALYKHTEAIRESNETRHTEQGPSPEITARVNLPESVEVHQSAANATKERQYRNRTLLVSALTLGAIVIYAVLVYLQYGQMIESNKISRDSLIAVQRAFIHFKEIHVKGLTSEDTTGLFSRQWSFIAATENSGNTPGIEVVNAFGVQNHFLADKEFLGIVKKTDLRKTVVGPKAPLYLGPQNRNEDFIFGPNLPKNGKFRTFAIDRPLVLFGWIAYRDVFPKTKLHVTEFCQQLTVVSLSFNGKPPKVMPTYPPLEFNFQFCPDHNCTDEYCPDYKELETFVNSPQPPTPDPFGVDKLRK